MFWQIDAVGARTCCCTDATARQFSACRRGRRTGRWSASPEQITHLRSAELQGLGESGHARAVVACQLRGLLQQRRHLPRVGARRVSQRIVSGMARRW